MTADTGQFDKKMSRSNQTVINFNQQIARASAVQESSLGKMFGGIGGMAARYLGPLAAAAFVGWGVKLAADAEKAQTAFGTMLGSADKAKVLLSEIATFAASTPFESPELRTAAQSLLSFGVSAGNVMDRLKMLGDVAAGSNSEISDLALIYGKTLAKGKFELEQGNQLAERGIPIYSTLAKNVGVSQSKLMEMISAGQISAAQVQTAFESMAGSGGIFEDAMKKQSTTLWGLWSSLMDNIGLIATDIGQMIVDAFGFKEGLGSLVGATGFIREGIQSWKPIFFAARDLVVDVFGAMMGVISGFAAFIQPIIQPILDWFTGTFGSTFTGVRDNLLSVFFALQWAVQNWQLVMSLAATQAALAFETFKADISNIFTNVIPTIFNNFGTASFTFFKNLSSNIGNLFKEVFDYIKSGGTDAINFEWKPLIIDEIKNSFKRELTASENALIAAVKLQKGIIDNEMGTFINEKMDKATKKAAELNKDILGDKTKSDQVQGNKAAKGEAKGAAAFEKGTVAAYEASSLARQDNPMLEEMSKQTKLAEKNNELLTDIAKNQGGATLAPI